MASERKSRIRDVLALQGLMLLFSGYSVLAKFAGNQAAWSAPFFAYYGLSILPLGVYAILWQRVIKRVPLTSAYANRAVAVVWGMAWGAWIFRETINAKMLIGAALILAGVALFGFSGERSGAGE